jgi:hypothetical protein
MKVGDIFYANGSNEMKVKVLSINYPFVKFKYSQSEYTYTNHMAVFLHRFTLYSSAAPKNRIVL